VRQIRQLSVGADPGFADLINPVSPRVGPGARATIGTYALPTDMESVVWNYGQLPDNVLSGLLETYIHSHAYMLFDMLIFQGSPHQVFYDVSRAEESRQKLYVGGRNSLQTFMRNIEQRQLKEHPAFLACSYMTASRVEFLTVGHGEVRPFYRKPRCFLEPTINTYLIVALHRRPPGKLVTTPTYEMHVTVRIFYEGERGVVYVDNNTAYAENYGISSHPFDSNSVQYNFQPEMIDLSKVIPI